MPLELNAVKAYLMGLQDAICDTLTDLDGQATFREDAWERPGGGGGRSRVLTAGLVFEKAGVGFSHVHGPLPVPLQAPGRMATSFDAMGVSLVIHPQNPYVPVVHMNVRAMALNDGEAWFGGGIDLSPAYPNEADTRFFHGALKQVCDAFHPGLYHATKAWCDDYFTIRHRHEMRGVGGIFYDYLNARHPQANTAYRPLPEGADAIDGFALMQALGNAFAPTYAELVQRNRTRPFGEAQRQWQFIRRGRYAEFNLVYDRGTTFGLQTDGRVESILMSLPPLAAWVYDHHPLPNTEEAEALAYFQPKRWF